MLIFLSLLNTAILLVVFGTQLRQIFKEKVLDKTDLDEKLIAKVKELAEGFKKS